MAEVLLVEDDPVIRGSLGRALSERGHGITYAATGMAGLEQVVASRPDVVVLDLGLPDIDGSALLRMLRSVTEVPVIVATARDDEAGIVACLKAGADDYVVKPFTADHLDARIEAVLRRSNPPADGEQPLVIGELRIDADAREVTLAGSPIDLARLEFELLLHLARNHGRVVSKRELLAKVWGQPHGGADKTVEVHLSWLRRKLGETAAQPRFLHTIRGVGVKLVAPAESADDPESQDRPPLARDRGETAPGARRQDPHEDPAPR